MRLFLSLLMLVVPTLAFASTEDSFSGFVYRMIAFFMFFGALYLLLNKRVRAALEDSVEEIRSSLSNAEKSREDAMSQLAEYSRKMADMNKELESLKAAARKAVEQEAEKILSDAEATVGRLRDLADSTLKVELEIAKDKIRKEAVISALSLAEKQLSESSDDFKSNYTKSNIKNLEA